MRYYNQIVISTCILFASTAHAVDFYADALYWQASETVDWALTNNLSLPNQVISYKTINFNFSPGFRVGAGLQTEDWNSRVLYTKYKVRAKTATYGNVISALMPSKFAEKFYNASTVDFFIDFNMFDVDLYKKINITDSLFISPLIGLKTGWINQSVMSAFYGTITDLDIVTNNFTGVGPKVGAESQWFFYKRENYKSSIFANFGASFMWGNWSIHDTLTQSNSPLKSYVHVGPRDFGALAFQGLVGVSLDYNNASLKVGYEVSDWLDQYQVFDNAVGTHTNDLVLQGLTVAFNFHC